MQLTTRHRIVTVSIGLLVLVLIFLGVFLALGKTKPSREGSTVIPSPADPNRPHHPSTLPIEKGLLANTIDGTVLLLDLESDDYDLIVEEYLYRVTAFDYYLNESVFYATTKSFEPIKCTAWRDEEIMANSGSWTKTALSVDSVTRKLYVVDGESEQLNLLDFEGRHFAILLADLDKPRDVALDPLRSLVFVLEARSIRQANMDGSGNRVILDQQLELMAFSLDRDNAVVYYATSCAIKSLNYLYSSSPTLVASTDVVISSLAVLDKQLYFVGTFEETGRASLTSCSLVGGACKKFHHNVIDARIAAKLQSIKVYDNRRALPWNPCESGSHAGCQHLCVPMSNDPLQQRSYSCVCAVGYRLNSDLKTCSRIGDYLLYIEDDKIKRSSLEPGDSATFMRAVDSSISIDASALEMRKLMSFDYSYERNLLVYADYANVHYVDLTNGTSWMIEGSKDCGLIPAVDWSAEKLYYARNCRNRSSQLLARSVNNENDTFESEVFLAKIGGRVGALVVHPIRGVIFFTQFSKEVGKYLLRAVRTDGRLLELGKNITARETGLCVDYTEDWLYWLSQDGTKILHANFEDFQPSALDISIVGNPRTVSVYNEWLYVSNLTEVWRVDKETGGKAARVLPVSAADKLKVIHDAKVFGRVLQPIDKHRRRTTDVQFNLIKR